MRTGVWGVSLLLSAVLLSSCMHRNEEKVVLASYADGKPKMEQVFIVNDKGQKQLYKETHYFPEEKKYIEGTYDEFTRRDGKWTSWYENGKKNSQGTYENGKLQGKYTVWHPNGKVFYEGKYKNGVKTGTWTYYDTLGHVIQTEVCD